VSDQIGFSELLQSILGPERKILASDKEMFHLAMRIDELEEILEQDNIFALFWVNQHIKKKGRAEFLQGLEHNYSEADDNYDETDSIEGIERHFLDGMQYVYCYLKDLPANETTRIDAVKWFLSERTEHNLGRVLIAYATGWLIEAMLEE